MNKPLLKIGATGRLEVMRARRKVSELQGKISAVKNKYLQDARQEAIKLAEYPSSSRDTLEERQTILGHTAMTAPVEGIVKYLRVTAIGGMPRAVDESIRISPPTARP